jgi:hypothetical protein
VAEIPVAIVASVEDVVVMPDASHIVVTLDVGGPKVDLALEPTLALNLVDASANGYAEALKIKKVPKEQRTLFPASGFEVGENKQRGVIGLTINFELIVGRMRANAFQQQIPEMLRRLIPAASTCGPLPGDRSRTRSLHQIRCAVAPDSSWAASRTRPTKMNSLRKRTA